MGHLEPSAKTVIRFIATPVNPDPILNYGSFVVGHGWGTSSGRQHLELAKLYNLERNTKGQYAGYLHLEEGKAKLFSGGSASLFLPESAEKNEEIEELLKDCGAFARILGNLFPLITAGTVPHVMVAVFW